MTVAVRQSPRPLSVASRQAPRALLVAVCLAVVVWLAIKATEGGQAFLQVTLNGLTAAALYFVVAAGFAAIGGLVAAFALPRAPRRVQGRQSSSTAVAERSA